MSRIALLTLVVLGIASTLAGQGNMVTIGATSPPLPTPSPVVSTSIDDIPPAYTTFITADGNSVNPRANFMLSYMDVSPFDQRVWFTISGDQTPASVYYNHRTRASIGSPWYWSYSYSYPVLNIHQNDQPGPPSFALGTVLRSSTGSFRDPTTGIFYEYLMYGIYQNSNCNGVSAGFLSIGFSHDGTSWVGPYQAVRVGGPSFPCWPTHINTVPIEAVSAVFDGSFTVYLMGLEGNGALLVNRTNMDRTLTIVGWTDVNSLGLVQVFPGASEVSPLGVVKHDVFPGYGYGNRFTSYAYFINMQMAWDEASGYLYVSRAYPYGFDRGSTGEAPSGFVIPHSSVVYNTVLYNPFLQRNQRVDGCDASPAAGPTRVQVYKMYLGTLSNFGGTTTGTWSLVTDAGTHRGYKMPLSPTDTQQTTHPGMLSGMADVGRDLGSGSFVTDGYGNLKRYGALSYWLGGSDIRHARTIGPATCRLTGDERVVAYAFTP